MVTTFMNRYRVLSELGQGTMGKVYRVADTVHGDHVIALKTIRVAGEITEAHRLSFKEEFRITAQLKHPNTLEVYDFGTLDDHNHFYTMEVVPGHELADMIAEGPLALERFYPMLIQLLQALNFIHSRHYVHRDIKAQNIRVREDGTLKLMDFGLTCQSGISSKGQLTGTPGYMAPELVWGGTVDGASDLYSVGCLAYEMLTGRLPFVGRVSEVIRAHRDERPVLPRKLRPEVPERLEALVMKLLEKEPHRRYRTCKDVISDLAALAGITLARENLDQRKSYLNSRAMVGREQELETLTQALGDLKQGNSAAFFVGAPAGVGKSRLMEEFLRLASLNELFVLQGTSQEGSQAPYEAITMALKRAIPYTHGPEWARFGPVLSSLFPQLIETGLVPPLTPEQEEEAQDKLRLHDTILDWLVALSERTPLVLFLDDLHQADRQSLEVFNHCIRHRKGGRLLFLGTFRSDETPPSSPVWFTQEEGLSRYFGLGPLTSEQLVLLLKEMLNAATIPSEFSRVLMDVTGGNPFFVREVLLFLLEEGLLTQLDNEWRFPQDLAALARVASVEAAIVSRLSHMSEAARELAQVAAVLGRNMSLEPLMIVSGLEEDDFFNRLDELVERQFLIKGDEAFTFGHDRLRETLYNTTPEPIRHELHLRSAQHLESRSDGSNPNLVFDLAYHYTKGQDPGAAFEYLCSAGDISYQRNADAQALDYWGQAVVAIGSVDQEGATDQEFDLLIKIGRSGFILSPREAINAFERALEILGDQRSESPETLATKLEVLMLLANAYGFLGAPLKGLEVVERALAICPEEAKELHAAILTVQATNLMAAGRFDEMGQIARQAGAVLMREDLEGQPPLVLGARVGVASFQNAVCFQGVRPDENLAKFAYWASAQIGDEMPITIRQFFAIWYAWTGRHQEATQTIEELAHISRRIGAPPYHWVLYLLPYVLYQRGEYTDALALLETGLQYPHLEQVELTVLMMRVLHGQVLLALGQHEPARTALMAVLDRSRTIGMSLVTIQALLGLGAVESAQGDQASAEQSLREAYDLSGSGPAHNPLHHAIASRLLGEVVLKTGRAEAARAYAEEALAIVSRPEQDNWIEQAHGHRLLGEVQHARGLRDKALEALRTAGGFYRRLKNPDALHGVTQRLEEISKQEPPPKAEPAPNEGRMQFMRGMLN